jgi:hypothetical protein
MWSKLKSFDSSKAKKTKGACKIIVPLTLKAHITGRSTATNLAKQEA